MIDDGCTVQKLVVLKMFVFLSNTQVSFIKLDLKELSLVTKRTGSPATDGLTPIMESVWDFMKTQKTVSQT